MKNSNLTSVLDQSYWKIFRKCCDVVSGKVYYFSLYGLKLDSSHNMIQPNMKLVIEQLNVLIVSNNNNYSKYSLLYIESTLLSLYALSII